MTPNLQADSTALAGSRRRPAAAVLASLTMTAIIGLASPDSAGAAPRRPTTTTLSSSTSSTTFGAPVSFRATVDGPAPATGTVEFSSDGQPIAGCEAQVVANRRVEYVAGCSTSTLSVGSHSIVARFSGSLGQLPSTSPPVEVVVNKAVSSVSVSCNPNPVTYPNTVACTATVSNAYTMPTGKVTWTASGNGYFVSTGCYLDAGTCSVRYQPRALGGITIRATYLGSATHTTGSASTLLAVK